MIGVSVTRNGAIPMSGFDRITFDSDVMGGRACIRGMRITVSLVVNLVAAVSSDLLAAKNARH